MKKQFVIVGIIVLLICVGLSGCNESSQSSEKSRFVGTWRTDSQYSAFAFLQEVTFFSDGTISFAGQGGVYEIKDGALAHN